MIYDLHSHSTASDGALSPSDLVARAKEKGVDVLALTDHDTVAGLPEAALAAKVQGLRLINGVEASAVWRGHTIHILGLDFELDDPAMTALMADQLARRWARAEKIAQRLKKEGLGELLTDATRHAAGDVPGRPHFAKALIERQQVKDFNRAFDLYLGAGKVGDVKDFWLSLDEVVQRLVASGAVAVLAHPRKYKMTATRLRELLAFFKSAGGEGLEVLSPGNDSGDIGLLAEYATRFGLVASVGSDFHAPTQPWSDIGKVARLPDGLAPVWTRFRSIHSG